MNLSGNTVLITGGASGIGLALVERFLARGNKVIICGRRQEKLREAQRRFPELEIRRCDVSVEVERQLLFDWVKKSFPDLNILVNNAGVQHRMDLLLAQEKWGYYQEEILTNFAAPVHLSMLFIPHLAAKPNAAIINITSGLAFTPMAIAPIYSATKAALHSFTMSLRHVLADKNVSVIEVAPPAVNTDLGGAGLHTFGVPLEEFADAVFKGFERGDLEIGYGPSEKLMRMSRDEIDEACQRMNSRMSLQQEKTSRKVGKM